MIEVLKVNLDLSLMTHLEFLIGVLKQDLNKNQFKKVVKISLTQDEL